MAPQDRLMDDIAFGTSGEMKGSHLFWRPMTDPRTILILAPEERFNGGHKLWRPKTDPRKTFNLRCKEAISCGAPGQIDG